MARKIEIYVVPTKDGDRDSGKRFKITEMTAYRAEKWALRVLIALGKSGANLPENYESAGMAALAVAGFEALQNLDWEGVEPLLDEMFTCVRILTDPRNSDVERPLVIGKDVGDDIEEITTIFTLRRKIFELHTNFFFKGATSKGH